MNRVLSASGTTTAVNQDIVSVMRGFTTLGSDDTIEPFRPKMTYFECSSETTININGEGNVFLKETEEGVYSLTLGYGDVNIKTLQIANNGVAWKTTFLF